MARRNWPDHPGIGRKIKFNGEDGLVVDVKVGPMMLDTSTMDQPSAKITGTLKLRIKTTDGKEFWLPPIDGDNFIAWCERQDTPPDTGMAGNGEDA